MSLIVGWVGSTRLVRTFGSGRAQFMVHKGYGRFGNKRKECEDLGNQRKKEKLKNLCWAKKSRIGEKSRHVAATEFARFSASRESECSLARRLFVRNTILLLVAPGTRRTGYVSCSSPREETVSAYLETHTISSQFAENICVSSKHEHSMTSRRSIK